ncbi:uncharacterized protein LOC122505057 [Leptopilina heterotoma]|uniref:uncharacterized protein LOC122505057 n=1 Tax=Leptopilina heterotoma TaxID=63436 RepID=UPI001CA7F3FA|nr:uncharacterized protein LOC122505057 [Leptopilina heterotoma]
MNIIGIGNVIAIMFALTLQIVMSTRITASERAEEFDELCNKQSEAINNNIADFFKYEAWNYVKKYLLSSDNINLFLKEVNETGYPHKSFINRRLKNPLNFRILRYFTDLESSSLTLSNANEIVNGFKRIFNYQSQISTAKLYQKYMERNLKEVVSFENYYALMAFLEDKSLISKDSPAMWKIINAIYSLTIRQYKSVLKTFPNDNPIFNCYLSQIMNTGGIATLKHGMIFDNSNFLFCNKELENIVQHQTGIERSRSKVYFNLTFWEYHQVVNIREITNNHQDLYIIFPDTKMMVSGPPYITRYNGIHITIVPIFMQEENKENQLVKIANAIEYFKIKEVDYLKRHQ